MQHGTGQIPQRTLRLLALSENHMGPPCSLPYIDNVKIAGSISRVLKIFFTQVQWRRKGTQQGARTSSTYTLDPRVLAQHQPNDGTMHAETVLKPKRTFLGFLADWRCGWYVCASGQNAYSLAFVDSPMSHGRKISIVKINLTLLWVCIGQCPRVTPTFLVLCPVPNVTGNRDMYTKNN